MCMISIGAALGGMAAAIASSVAGAVGATTAAATAASVSTAALGVASTFATTATGLVTEIAVAGALVGGIAGTVGAVQQAEQQRAEAEFYAEQAEENARLSRREAEAIEVMGNQEKLQLRQKMLAQKSSGRAGYAAGGVVLGSGTTLDYEADIADAYDSDARNLEYDIKSRKWQKQVEAANATDQASMYRVKANYAEKSKTTSLISGVFNTIGDTAQTGMSAFNSMGKLKGAKA